MDKNLLMQEKADIMQKRYYRGNRNRQLQSWREELMSIIKCNSLFFFFALSLILFEIQESRKVEKCKERWRNLRAVFVRHMKPGRSDSGSKNKKPYYLEDVMQFAVPYIKALNTTPPGNVQNTPQQERFEHSDDSDNEESVLGQNSQSSVPLEPALPPVMRSPSSPTPPPVRRKGTSSEQQYCEPSYSQVKKRVSRNNTVEGTFVDDFPAKKAKLNAASQRDDIDNPRREALKMFLLSMLPDVESMTDHQVRQFKRGCLHVIDEILYEPPYGSYSPSSAQSQSPSHSDHSSMEQTLILPL